VSSGEGAYVIIVGLFNEQWTKKLVTFLLGVVSHQVADVSWHSLRDVDQGFLEAMAQV